MGITLDIIRVAVNTSTGNQTFTGSLGGLTPKAARFIMVAAITDGTAANDKYISVGATDGTREWCVGSSENDATANSETQIWYRDDKCVDFVNEAGTVIASATFVSFNANNVIINWTTAPGSAWLLTVEFFAGSDLSVYAGAFDIGDTVDSAVDVTDPGFEPDILFTAMFDAGSSPNAVPSGGTSYGLIHNDGASTITQRAIVYYSRDGRASQQDNSYIRNDAGTIEIGTASLDFYTEFSDFDSSGFSATARNAGGNLRDISYLALSFGGVVDSKIITYSSPTSTGDDANTDIGFKPQALYTINHQIDVLNTMITNARVGTWGISSMISGSQFSNSTSSEDGAATINAQSLSDNIAFNIPDDDGSAGLTGTLSSFDANGFTINYSAVGAAAFLLFVLAVEEEAAVGGDSNAALLGQIKRRKFQPLLVR